MQKALITITVAISLVVVSLGQPVSMAKAPPDLKEATAQINGFVSSLYAETEKAGQKVNRDEASKKTADFARKVLGGVDLKAIPDDEANKWADLFEWAQNTAAVKELRKKSVQYLSVQLMFATGSLIPALLDDGKSEQVLYLLRHAPDYESRQIGMIGDIFFSNCQKHGLDKSNPAYVEQGLSILKHKLDAIPSEFDAGSTSMLDNVRVEFAMDVLRMRYAAKPSEAVLQQVRSLRAEFAHSSSRDAFNMPPTKEIDDFLTSNSIVGKRAPSLVFEKSIGDFSGLSSLRGKVVMLDFMAHWCGPCKAALPGIQKMQQEFGPRGFQVVSITSFYGYFGPKTGVSVKDEFAMMHQFVKDNGMTWPVLFDTKQATQGVYGVSGIPYLVIIDKSGLVRRIEVGHTPKGEAEIRQLVETLLKA